MLSLFNKDSVFTLVVEASKAGDTYPFIGCLPAFDLRSLLLTVLCIRRK